MTSADAGWVKAISFGDVGKRTGSGRNPSPVSEQRAAEIDIASSLDGPIRRLDHINRSLLFAEISMLSYLPDAEAGPVFKRVGFADVTYIERDGAQAYALGSDDDLVVVCRGTEPNEWNDIRADANAWTALSETVGRVHRGFKREVDDVWPSLEELLIAEERQLWFAGHSLGGAMATICAGRCHYSERVGKPVKAVYSYGSPRVGTKRYIQHAKLTHVRWVHNNDIVTRVPPRWLGYRHTGVRMYLDRNGDVRHFTAAQRAKDRAAGFREGLRKRRFDHFSDHAIADYVRHIRRGAEAGVRSDAELAAE